jgi:TonB family protein
MLVPWVAWLAASTPDAKPLPGNKQCPYPPRAQERFVAGPVSFTAQVRPDGSVESVEVPVVPAPGLDFEESVKACVGEWRFEPAAADAGRRTHQGRLRFRLDPEKEAGLRALVEAYAAAWNAGDAAAIRALALRPEDSRAVPPGGVSQPDERLREAQQKGSWRMELEPELASVQLLEGERVVVQQRYRRLLPGSEDAPDVIRVHAARTGRGWRVLSAVPSGLDWASARYVGGAIPEPRKVKHVAPRFPDLGAGRRVQGIVIIECLISRQGKVEQLHVLRGIPELDAAALAAVRHWEYAPTIVNGEAVPVVMIVPVDFRLR